MFKRLLNGQVNSITLAAGLVAFSSLLSRLLGVFRDRILASEFGAGDVLDIYYAAFKVPDFIFNLLILGALSAGFIPVFTALIKKENEQNEAWEFVSNVLNIIVVILVGISLVGIIFAPALMKFIAPGFTSENQMITANLMRIMFLSPLFLGISGVLGGVLQSMKCFFVYSLAPIFYNVGIIVGALFFVPRWGIYGLAWGVVLGAFVHMMAQVPAIFSLGFKYSFGFNWRSEQIKKIGTMMIPRTLSLATTQINFLVITIIASTLTPGSLTIFNLANNLQFFPIGIFAISFAVAAFPTLSAASFDNKKIADDFSSTARQILFFIVPSTVLLLTLRAQIIRVILGAGQFTWEDTILTMNALGFFALSLFAQALIPLMVRVFYARHNSKTPFYIGAFVGVINIGLSYWLAGVMGVVGLALAFSISNIIYFAILWLRLHNEIGSLDEMKILVAVLKFSGAAMLAGSTIQIIKLIVWPYIDMTKTWGVFTQGFLAGAAGLAVYVLASYILKSEELLNFWAGLKRRMSWNKLSTDDQGEARGI